MTSVRSYRRREGTRDRVEWVHVESVRKVFLRDLTIF